MWLPNLAIHLLRPPGLPPAEPFALAESAGGLRRIAAADPAANEAGVREGQKLAEAQAICPALHLADADPDGDQATLRRLAGWCERYTPMATADAPDGLSLDITGCAHLLGDEAALAKDLQTRLQSRDLPSRIAIASTAAAAWAFARWAAPEADAPILSSQAREHARLGRLPVAALRINARTIAGLHRLGLRSIGDMLRIPRAELAAGFGQALLTRLDQALGRAEEAIIWPHPPPPWAERIAFAEPIMTPEDLRRTLTELTERLCRRLEATHQGTLRLAARFFRVDGLEQRASIAVARPVREPAYLTKLLAARLEQIDPGFGIEIIALEAGQVAPLAAPQSSFAEQQPRTPLAQVVDTLGNRLGEQRLWRITPHASHIPERATQRLPPLVAPSWTTTASAPRPLRLLRQPEPIEAMAALPDEPPRLFRWRRALHRLRGASGPERIAREWWTCPPETPAARPEHDRLRDYYCVEDTDGARFWIFRVGLNGPSAWFLHGFFG